MATKKVQPKKSSAKTAAKRTAKKSTRESLQGGKKSIFILPVK